MTKEDMLRIDFESYLRGEEPPVVALATAPVLDDWYVDVIRDPDVGLMMTLVGTVTGHPSFPDGRRIHTSVLAWLDRKHRWARTRSRVYRLDGMAIPIDGVDL